jgi:hypothetical protein
MHNHHKSTHNIPQHENCMAEVLNLQTVQSPVP